MRENKNLKVVMIITVVSILLVFSGITYAYFSAFNSEGSTAEITVGPGKMLITYNDGTDNLVPVTDIQPSDAILVNKTFTLTGTNTATGVTSSDGLNMPYKVGLKYTSTFSDGQIHYYIKEVNRPTDSNVTVEYTGTTNQTVQGNATYTGYSHDTLKNGNKYTEMVTGEIPSSSKAQTITFNLILQFPDIGENQDSEKGATINGKITVNYEPPKATTFAADSWENIAAVIQRGKLDAYPVGSEKEVEIDGKSYTVRVANNTTPEECNQEDFSQTACGFVVEFVDIVERRVINDGSSSLNYNIYNEDVLIESLINNVKNNNIEIKMLAPELGGTNVGGWHVTPLRTYANGDFYNNLPSDLQKVIIDTKVVSGHGSTSGETNFTSTDKIYLLSTHEIWEDVSSNSNLKTYDTAYNKTRQLDYYNSKGVTTSNYSSAIKQYNGSNSWWWLRAAYSYTNSNFWSVDGRGSSNDDSANITDGFAPAFRIG